MDLAPMLRDIEAPADPDAIMLLHIIEKAGQRHGTTGPSHQTAMQTDRHHARMIVALGIKAIETVFEIGKEIFAAIEALGGHEAHVIGFKRIGYHEMRLAGEFEPIRQLIRIGIRVIKETAMLGDEPAAVRTHAPGVPALRLDARYFLDRLDRQRNMRTF